MTFHQSPELSKAFCNEYVALLSMRLVHELTSIFRLLFSGVFSDIALQISDSGVIKAHSTILMPKST